MVMCIFLFLLWLILNGKVTLEICLFGVVITGAVYAFCVAALGCPKLDGVDYTEKLAEILRSNNIRSVTVLRMEVPCCGGLEMAARRALEQCGRDLPWQVCTVHIDGTVTKN